MAGGGGGGSAGPLQRLLDADTGEEEIAYPLFMQNTIAEWLFGVPYDSLPAAYSAVDHINVADQMETAAGRNPFNAATPYNPDADLSDAKDRLDSLIDYVDSLDTAQDLETDATTAQGIAENSIYPTTRIDALVESFEDRQALRFARAASRIAAGMQDIQATMTTQFGMALTQLELDRAMEVNAFDAQAQLQRERDIQDFTRVVLDVLNSGRMQRVQVLGTTMQAQIDLARLNIIAGQDYIEKQLEYKTRHTLWNLELFQYGTNVLASVTGAAMIPRAQTKGERLISAFTGSAAFGIQVGSALKNPGAGLLAGGALFAAEALVGLR